MSGSSGMTRDATMPHAVTRVPAEVDSARIADSPPSSRRAHVAHPAGPSRRPEGRHRVFRRPRHQRRAALDAREGRDSLRVHGEPRPARRARLRRHSAPRAALRRRGGAARRLPRRARRRRHRRAAGGRVPHLDRRRDLLQHDAARPRGHRHDARRRDERGRRPHLGRRQHVQGQRHRALLSLRPARQSRTCASTSRGSTRSSSTSWAAARRCRST